MIRPATPADVAAITAIAQAAFAPYAPRIGRNPAPMDADYAALVADGAVVVAGDVDGFLVTEALSDTLLLDTVAVAPHAQGRGIGRALMAEAERQARALGLPTVQLYTNALMHENLALYPRLGYTETGRRSDAGFDRVFFEKRLSRD